MAENPSANNDPAAAKAAKEKVDAATVPVAGEPPAGQPWEEAPFSEKATWSDWLILVLVFLLLPANIYIFALRVQHFGGAIVIGLTELAFVLLLAWIANARSVYHFTARFSRKILA